MDYERRTRWIDICKGISILLVIVAHSTTPFNKIIYSFHMPLFFILSGYTFTNKNAVTTSIINDFKRLILPGIFTIFLGAILGIINGENIYNAMLSFIYGTISGDYFSNIYVDYLWFLYALFWSKTLYRLIVKYIENYRITFLMFLACFNLFSYSLIGHLPHYMDSIFICILYMECGHLLKSLNFPNHPSKSLSNIIVSICFVIWASATLYNDYEMDMATRTFSLISIILSVLGTICVIAFSFSIEQVKPSIIFEKIGKHSLLLLCIHQLDKFLFVDHLKAICINWLFVVPIRCVIDLTIMISILSFLKFLRNVKQKTNN